MFDAIKLLRIPFSIFLMPVYWLSLSQLASFSASTAIHIFIILHFFIYPASNGYNSLHDKDEGSIGGLKRPPKVNDKLFPLVIFWDVIGLLYSYLIDPFFAVLLFIYVLISKAYSYKPIRLKRFAILSTLTVALFQGAFIYLSIQYALAAPNLIEWSNLLIALTSTLFLLGSYPITQIYQHEEDRKRGDHTLSMWLGIKGTLLFSSIFFAIGSSLLIYSFYQQNEMNSLFFFLAAGSPILIYFSFWQLQISKNLSAANYENTMKMNVISSLCLSAAFILMLIF